ncbi:hypothetical protein [Brevifollis gellanilyticus]|nr:hypothetical protein [Brevifollis gellanilyticus]
MTRRWKEVISLIAEGGEVAKIANATMSAADKALERLSNDPGFAQAAWLLTRLGIAGKQANPKACLEEAGIRLPQHASLADVAVALALAVDMSNTRTSDIGLIAKESLIAAVVERLHEKAGLFEASSDFIHAELGALGRDKAFGELSRVFFAQVTNRSIGYFLDRTLPLQMGPDQKFKSRAEVMRFRVAMDKHCHETAEIVEKYASEWFSKNRFQGDGDIGRDKSEGFGWYGIQKIRAELMARAKDHAD